jgi:hypothetical protein
VVTTPNIASWKAVHRILSGRHPALWSVYRPNGSCDRHNREYSFDEVRLLVETAGFEVVEMDALDVYDDGGDATPLEGYGTVGRGDTTFCLSRKVGAVADRWPSWLYDQGGLV